MFSDLKFSPIITQNVNLQSHCRAQGSGELCSKGVARLGVCWSKQVMQKRRERCWKAFLDSAFDYSDSCPPGTASVSVMADKAQGADVNAGWLHNHWQVGNNPAPQLPCCPYLFFFIHAANCQALCLPGWPHSCASGPQHSCAGTSRGSWGCDGLWEHRASLPP